MKTKNCESCFIIIDQIKEYFENHLSEFCIMVEAADNLNGCLGDDRLISMSCLDVELCGLTPSEILERAFFGFDYSPRSLMSRSDFTPCSFNPNEDFFYWNGYGNLVSVRECLVPEYYSKFIDRYHVEQIFNSWFDGDLSDDLDDELYTLFVALSGFED